MKIRATATSPEITITELGFVDAEEAIRLFREYPWQEEIARGDVLAEQGVRVISPDLTLSDLPAHMIISGKSPDRFDVEVCLPLERKLVGLFTRHKFYQLRAISAEQVMALIHGFFHESLAERHAAISASPLSAPIR